MNLLISILVKRLEFTMNQRNYPPLRCSRLYKSSPLLIELELTLHFSLKAEIFKAMEESSNELLTTELQECGLVCSFIDPP